MLSLFESSSLDRHLRRCGDCRAFAADTRAQAELLRGARLEEPARRVVIPARRGVVRRGAAGALGIAVAAAAAVALAVLPGAGKDGSTGETASGAGATVLVTFPANPVPATEVDVPRLRVVPASIADGPVRGAYFNLPAI